MKDPSLTFNIFSIPGRRYARWHLWRDKLVYILVFFIFILWLEWTIHSQVFPLEVRPDFTDDGTAALLFSGQDQKVTTTTTTTTNIPSSPGTMWSQVYFS